MKTTHIGSLPYKDIEQAIIFNQGLTLPCLPTLPQFDEREWMINQFTCGFMKDNHRLPFCCLDAFLHEFKGRIKVQVCGIQTLFNNKPTEVTKKVSKRDFIEWYKHIVRKFIDLIPNDFILFFDEPDLTELDKDLWDTYSDFSALNLGIHSCAKVEWKKLDLDVFSHISFDSRLVEPQDIDTFRAQGKVLFFGDIDTFTGEVYQSAISKFDYLTPSCGLVLSEDCIDLIKNNIRL